MHKSHVFNWHENKVKRFVDAWNDGVYIGDLKDRFGVKNPASLAQHLRKKGWKVEYRGNEDRF